MSSFVFDGYHRDNLYRKLKTGLCVHYMGRRGGFVPGWGGLHVRILGANGLSTSDRLDCAFMLIGDIANPGASETVFKGSFMYFKTRGDRRSAESWLDGIIEHGISARVFGPSPGIFFEGDSFIGLVGAGESLRIIRDPSVHMFQFYHGVVLQSLASYAIECAVIDTFGHGERIHDERRDVLKILQRRFGSFVHDVQSAYLDAQIKALV